MTSEINNVKCAQHMLDGMSNIDFPKIRASIYKPKWISVEEFLPPFHKRVLLYIPNIEYCHPINVGYMETEGNFYFNEIPEGIDAVRIDLVTHWMPLPEIPE